MNSERKIHSSTVPGWVRKYATFDNRFGYVLPERHRPAARVFDYVGLAFLSLGVPWVLGNIMIGVLSELGVIPWLQWENVMSSRYWLVLPSLILVGLPTMRSLARRWIRTTWKRITGEEGLERYLYATYETEMAARETLKRVARRVRGGEIKDAEFHVARDIAAMHMVCDRDLRIRDLVGK